jgi:hypothetical protein
VTIEDVQNALAFLKVRYAGHSDESRLKDHNMKQLIPLNPVDISSHLLNNCNSKLSGKQQRGALPTSTINSLEVRTVGDSYWALPYCIITLAGACGSDDSFEASLRFKETTAKIASRTNRMSRTTRIATAVA